VKEFELAFAYFVEGNLQQAQEMCVEILGKNPDDTEALQLLGLIYGKQGQFEQAAKVLGRVIELRPKSPKTYNNFGFALMKTGNLDGARKAFENAILLQSDFKQAHNNLGLILKKIGNFSQAESAFQKALQIDAKYGEAVGNLGMLYLAEGKFELAAENLRKAIGFMPKVIEFYNNLGTALMELEKFDEALAAFNVALKMDPQLAQSHHNRALVLLLRGEFEQGWKEFEWRWKNSNFATPIRPFNQKRWNGNAEGVGKLLIWAEQGIGDEVQFSGLIPLVMAKGIKVVFECDKRLVSIMQRSLPEAVIVGRSEVPAKELSDKSITHQIPLCSLPMVLGWPLDLKSNIVPDENLRGQLRNKYKGGEDVLLVGVSWRSGNRQEGPKRSIDLEKLEPIFKTVGVKFVSLQYGDCLKEIEDTNKRFGISIINDETINPLTDLEGFAAQTAAMDVVISVDNSTVHFAGAMGVKVWTLLPKVPDWRWRLEGETTNWYPSMRLFRQDERGNWEKVIEKVAKEISNLKFKI
jgi:Flp pilus assembly protein TadD